MQHDAAGVSGAAESLRLRHVDGVDADVGQMQVAAGDRRDLARETKMRQEIWTVRRDVDHQASIAQRDRVEKGRAWRDVDIELHDAVVLLPEAQLARGA